MRNLRRLPPFLRVSSAVGLLCLVSAFVIIVALTVIFVFAHVGGVPGLSQSSVTALNNPWFAIGINLSMLGNVCIAAESAYDKRFDSVPPNPLPLDSLRQQVLAVLLPSLAPLCAITLDFTISPASSWFGVVFGVSLFGAMGVLASVINLGVLSGSISTLG